VCCFLMLLTGGLLNATTVLQPQFLQGQIGYTATIAGFTLSGGGLALVFVMPLAGQAVSRFPARNLIAFGFTMFALSYYYTASHLSLGISFAFASKMRILQVWPIPFAFISITTAAYFGQPREKSNQIAGLVNFVRNIGGSILIAATNAEVTQRAQWHENQLQKYAASGAPGFSSHLSAMTELFRRTAGKANAAGLAEAQIYRQLQQQAKVLAYVDIFYVLCAAAILMIPLAFLLRKNQPAGKKTEIAVH
jgi:MFS transporter, DHA2 family, multidrug resistance protein